MVANHRRSTLRDVAQRAGTTIPTASKVLSGRSDVSDETRVAVLQAVAELEYRRPSGRTIATSGHEAPTIDLVISGIEGTWANRALSGVEKAAVEAGVDLIVSVARLPDEGWLTRMLARPSRGAVLALVNASASHLAALQATGIPVVLMDPVTQPPASVSSVGATNWAGAHLAARHLLDLGHRRLAVIAGRREQLYSQARVDGFRSTVAVYGDLPVPRVAHADWRVDRARQAATELFREADRPTGVFACSDQMALGVYEAAEACGLRIPEDVSVIGFDDLPEGDWVRPRLTTIEQPIADMGSSALRLLLRLSADPTLPTQREELSTRLLLRESTALAPA
jgi:DNA-binding LacI/PurR family transcriptional regulator